MKPLCLSLIVLSLWAPSQASAGSPSDPKEFPPPAGFTPCAPDDPVANLEARLALKIGSEFLGCFQSEGKITVPGAANVAPQPSEYAFAIAPKGLDYTQTDLDILLSKVREQWKDFNPLSKEFKETYISKLNELIKDSASYPVPHISSVKPILISIDRPADSYYTVTSIRSYTFESNGGSINMIKVNSDALLLRNSRLIRLTVQRQLNAPADVAQVQSEIDDWARVILRN